MMQAAFDGCRDRAAGRGAVAIPTEDQKMPLFFAQPRQRDARQRQGREQADVDPLNQCGDRRIEQRRDRLPRGVDDVGYVPVARHDVLGDLGQGLRISEVASEGDKFVVGKRVAGELGGECIHPAAHADQAPGNCEPRPGVGAGD